jgi:hypothetical protein
MIIKGNEAQNLRKEGVKTQKRQRVKTKILVHLFLKVIIVKMKIIIVKEEEVDQGKLGISLSHLRIHEIMGIILVIT